MRPSRMGVACERMNEKNYYVIVIQLKTSEISSLLLSRTRIITRVFQRPS